MRASGSARIIACVEGKVAIHLEISLAGESLTGNARDDRGTTREFDGRLGLLDAIDILVAARSASESEPPREPR